MRQQEERTTPVSLRQYLEKIIEERDRQYDTRFKAGETAVSAALAAQEKQTAAAFQAGEKAVLKAENAQKDYNDRSNEFRGQLDDQAKTLMPRAEVSTIMKALEEKLEANKVTAERDADLLRADVRELRDFRSSTTAKEVQKDSVQQQNNWSTALIATLIVAVIGCVISLWAAFIVAHGVSH